MQNFTPRQSNYRSPNTSRRGQGPIPGPPQPPHGAQANVAAQMAQDPQRLMSELHQKELAKRKARKPVDRDIPMEIGEAIVGDGVDRYKRLRDVERRLDATMMRKRLDILDNISRKHARREATLRVWISNTVDGQAWQVMDEGVGNDDGFFELGDNSNSTYRVKIEGRLLEDTEHSTEDAEKPATEVPRQKLSSFFKAITIDFDDRNPNVQPDGFSAIEWRRPQPPVPGQPQPPGQPKYDPNGPEASFDTLTFERQGDEEMHITIKLTRDEEVERFKLSPELADLLDTEEDDKVGVVQSIWEYCRAMGLQQDDDKRNVVCDDRLKSIFKVDYIELSSLADLLLPHLSPLPPIQLPYTIRVDKAYNTGVSDSNDAGTDTEEVKPNRPTVYDIRVALRNPLQEQLRATIKTNKHTNELKEIVTTDDHLALLVQKIHQTNAKRKFYDNLAKDPTSFIKRWISSQQRDLEVITAEAQRGGGEDASGPEFRRGGGDGVWGTELARESVGLWLARNQKAH